MSFTLDQICAVRQLCKEHGLVSVPFIQRKLKLSYDEAKELVDDYAQPVARKKINNRFR